MTTTKLSAHPYSAAHINHFNDGAIALVSYKTTVIDIDSEGWLVVHGLYSRTTIKHIGWFMRERGLTYQLAKALYERHEMVNIYTGELRVV